MLKSVFYSQNNHKLINVLSNNLKQQNYVYNIVVTNNQKALKK